MGKQLIWYLLIISASFQLAACSEMKVIGSAAVRELKAEGINVEWTASRTASRTVKN